MVQASLYKRKKILRLPGDVLQGDGVLHGELVRLALHSRLLDQHTRVSCQAWEKQSLGESGNEKEGKIEG